MADIRVEMEDIINILKDTVDDEAQRTNIYHDLINLFITHGESDFEDVLGLDDAFDTAHDEIQNQLDESALDYDDYNEYENEESEYEDE